MRKSVLIVLLLSVTLCSCRFYLVQNDTDQDKKMRIIYQHFPGCCSKIDKFKYFEEKGTIKNVKRNCKDSTCIFEFNLSPHNVLPLNTILLMRSSEGKFGEERIVATCNFKSDNLECDTILHKIVNEDLVDRFEKKAKLFFLIGRRKYVYTFHY